MILQNQIDKYLNRRAVNECIYKLSYGGKFIIVKGKTLTGSLFLIQKGYGWFREDTIKKSMLYLHFYNHIKATLGKHFTVRILSKCKRHYNLIKREQIELDKARFDSRCLNNNTEAYIPHWIDKGAELNLNKYLKSDQRKSILQQYKSNAK